MQRYFAKDEKLTLNDSDYHHIKKVMRMKTGDVYEVVYDNVVYKCKIPILFQLAAFNLLIITEIWHYCNTIHLPHENSCFQS